MNKEMLDYVYNYIMDDIENAEAMAVEYAINNLVRNKISVGNPIVDFAGSIKILEVNFDYHYYFLSVDEHGQRTCIDINEQVANGDYASRDIVVLFLLKHLGLRNVGAYYIHEGYLVRAVKARNGKIKLKQILSYGINSLNDAAQKAIGEEKPIYDRYKCECGKSIFFVKESQSIVKCPNCNKEFQT